MLCFIPYLSATVLLKMSVENLTEDSEAIIRGEVKEITCQWNEEKTLIYSKIRIKIKEGIKGKIEDEEIYIKQMGGVVGNIGQKIIGAPSFKEGEEVIVFLRRDRLQLNFFRVMGLCQGKFTVKEERLKEKDVSVEQFIRNIKTIIKSLEEEEK